jgi:hypothetical protein
MSSGCRKGLYFLLYQASYSKWLTTTLSSFPLLSRPFTDIKYNTLTIKILKLGEYFKMLTKSKKTKKEWLQT